MSEATFYPAAEIGEFVGSNPPRKDMNGWPLLIVREGDDIPPRGNSDSPESNKPERS
jgi:hypothetical protein